jgi:glycerol uptake facilitator-like aquaporin
MQRGPWRAAAAEAFGTALLLWTIVGSGIAVTRLSVTRDASDLVQLTGHAFAVGFALTLIILLLGPASGAHLNPVVTMAAVMLGHLPRSRAAGYVAAQLVGGVLGAGVANVMFALPAFQVATRVRGGWVLLVSEVGSTLGLVLIIFVMVRTARSLPAIATAVGAYIAAAIVLTPSTSFANPAVTLTRTLSDTYTGIARASVPGFVVAQLLGASIAVAIVWRVGRRWEGQVERPTPTERPDPGPTRHDPTRPK